MADDDDTPAGLTGETTQASRAKPSTRRRASRSAGPPESVPGDAATHGDATERGDAALEQSTPQVSEAVSLAKSVSTGPEAATSAATATALHDAEDEPDTEVVDDGGEAVAGRPPRSRRALVLSIVAGVLTLALVGAAVWLLVERNSASDRDAQRNAYVQTARQTVLNLTTIKPDSAKDDVDRILAGASGEFKSEFDGREDPFVSVVQEAGVTTVGKILEAGLESEDDNSAKVLVAARADVSTPDGTQNGPRDFRMRVTVTDDGGTLTASKVEFVP